MNNHSCTPSYPDIEYLRSLYPLSILPIYQIIADASDKLEYDGSILFDEYPDKELLYKLATDIIATIPEEYHGKYLTELVSIILINEFIHRRIRRRTF
jgi:hypothetical protein